jgi:hypothetical protein
MATLVHFPCQPPVPVAEELRRGLPLQGVNHVNSEPPSLEWFRHAMT